MGELDGMTAIVTGGARGIGRHHALRLATLGCDVAIVDKDLTSFKDYEAEAEMMTAGSTVEEVQNAGRRSIGIEMDVTDRGAQEEMARRVHDEWGRIDILVANAGGGSSSPPQTRASELTTPDLEAVTERNLYGTIYSVNAVAPYMKRAGSGIIVTVSSEGGSQAGPYGGYAHYGASKAAVAMYTRYLAQDLGPYGIRANCIAPGPTATGRVQELWKSDPDRSLANALGRAAEPEEIASVVQFLTTGLSSFVTGAVIPVDGGMVRGAS